MRNVRIRVHGGRSDPQPFCPRWHRWIVNRLDVDAIVLQQDVGDIFALNRVSNVTARLLPRLFFLDAFDKFGVVDEVIEERVPCLCGDACGLDHVGELVDAFICEC